MSTQYYDWESNGGSADQISMSGTQTGRTWWYTSYAPDGNFPDGYVDRPDLGGTNPYAVEKTFTEPGFQRGNPENQDSYMFLTLSAYKKLTNAAKSYRTINMHQKRKNFTIRWQNMKEELVLEILKCSSQEHLEDLV